MAQIFFKKIVINAANKFRPYELHLQQVLISFKTSNFNVGFFKYTRDNFYERKTLLTTNAYTLVQVEHYLYFYKKRGLKLLRMFIKLLFGKFKIRPRLHRFYKNARIRAKLRTNIRRFKKYRPLIIEFIELIRRFINHDAIKVVLDEQSVQDLKEKLKCKLTKSTKNYVLFSWLKTFLTSF